LTHILVTNDDGVGSAGLLALKQALEPLGRVSVIAPESNRSAIGRGITVSRPLHVEEVRLADGSGAFATDGTPVDCVRFALLGLLGEVPEVVVSGINLGYNLGDDVTYSGTVAAAFEGVLLGWPAMAVSAGMVHPERDQWDGSAYDFRAVARFAAGLVPTLLRERFPRRVLLNVNGPGRVAEEVGGARVTQLGRRLYDDQLELQSVEGERRRYSIYGNLPSFQPEAGTDFAAVHDGEISVTPLHFELTDLDGMEVLRGLGLPGVDDAAGTPE
jgi:5'-nucleotidase